jgi:hypothetical protein
VQQEIDAREQLLDAYRVALTEALLFVADQIGAVPERYEVPFFGTLVDRAIASGAFAAAQVSDETLAALRGELGLKAVQP